MPKQTHTSEYKSVLSSPVLKEDNAALSGYPDMGLLRFSTAGSVDDGKSTLLRRFLNDSKSVLKDQMQLVKEASSRLGGDEINLALLTDGLRAEREQGITMDVAYRCFATSKRKFIIADTPGHIEYTPNMGTGALTSDVAIVLIDARNGIVEQTKRHAYIASLLQIPNVILAINKMDLVNFSEDVYNSIKNEFESIAAILKFKTIDFIPISARDGDNVVEASVNTPWYNGVTLLQLLESMPVHNTDHDLPARFPVQYVINPDNGKRSGYKGYAGRVAGGVFNVGDTILALPLNRLSSIKAIEEGPVHLSKAFTPQSVTIRLEGNIELNRGDLLVKLNEKYPKFSSLISFHVCWFNIRPLTVGARYIVRHTTNETVASIEDIRYKVNFKTFEKSRDDKTVRMNDIALITIKTQKPLKYDDYNENRTTGSLILIDENSYETLGAGMILTDSEVYSYNI